MAADHPITPAASGAPQITAAASGQQGATVTTTYAGRVMKAYPVHEHEITSISAMNTMATVFFSLASAAFALAAGIEVNAAFTEKLTAEGAVLKNYGAPFLFCATIVCLLIGVWGIRRRRHVWNLIRIECGEPARVGILRNILNWIKPSQ